MAFQVAAGESAAAVGFVVQFDHHGGAGGAGARVHGVGVRHDQVDGLGLASANLLGLGHQVAVGAAAAARAEHEHADAGPGIDARLLNSDDPSNNLFNDQSGSSLADQAGLGDVDRAAGQPAEGLFDTSMDNGSLDDGGQGFFDGDGSDDGLFS